MAKVLVALSGGVDSSVAAAILKEEGCHLEGAIMEFEGVTKKAVDCAQKVALTLGIRFHRFDFTREFDGKIIDNFVTEYRKGRTPNPCILCNEHMKFGLFMNKADELGFETIATGHYAVLEKRNGRYLLKRGIDRNEQSYFLYRLSQRQLSKTILPLGAYTKEEVRKFAKKNKLPVAQRKKSQDVCFVRDGDYASYLRGIVPQYAGPIFNNDGEVIGEHEGVAFYTCGQRRGIGISHRHPYYVTRIDADNNAIYVGERKDVYGSQLIAGNLNFIPFDRLKKRTKITAKTRYVSQLSAAVVEPLEEGKVKVMFEKPQWAITPGQSVVFYHGSVVLGGGLIEQALA